MTNKQPVDSKCIMRIGKKLVNRLAIRAQNQIDSGDVHENQGLEFERDLNAWLSAYDRYLSYQERYEIKEYFWERIKNLDYKRQGINDPFKSKHPTFQQHP